MATYTSGVKRSISTLLNDSSDQEMRRTRQKTEEIKELTYPSTSGGHPTRPVPFQQPTSLLTFSYSSSRALEFTDSALRYYVDPPRGADLRRGYERWIKRPEEKGRLDGLLRAVSKMRTNISTSGGDGASWLKDIGVVTWRGVMTKILTAPYEERDGWEMNVMFMNGTMYFEEHVSDAKIAQKEDLAPHHRLQTYYGYSFESYCTSSLPDRRDVHTGPTATVEGWGGDVDTNVQWCSVVKTKLGNTRLIIGGEVDCVRGKFAGKTDTFVELKTSLKIRNFQDEIRFERKLLKFYFQSFLLGVPEIVVGFRTPSGQLTTTQSFQTIQLPRLVRGKSHAWDPLLCLDWGERLITFLATAMSQAPADAPDTSIEGETHVWRVKFEPRVGVSVKLLDQAGVEEVRGGENRVGFLPRWFVDELPMASVEASLPKTPASTTDGCGPGNERF